MRLVTVRSVIERLESVVVPVIVTFLNVDVPEAIMPVAKVTLPPTVPPVNVR